MSTGDFFQPPQLHTAADLDDMRHILDQGRPRTSMVKEGRPRAKLGRKESRVKPAHKIKNPLYSRALDRGVNDGNQGKTQNATGIPRTGNTFAGAMTYPGMGTGIP